MTSGSAGIPRAHNGLTSSLNVHVTRTSKVNTLNLSQIKAQRLRPATSRWRLSKAKLKSSHRFHTADALRQKKKKDKLQDNKNLITDVTANCRRHKLDKHSSLKLTPAQHRARYLRLPGDITADEDDDDDG